MGIDAIKACNINAMPQFKGNSAAATTSKPETKENGNALLYGSIAALAVVGAGIMYKALKGKPPKDFAQLKELGYKFENKAFVDKEGKKFTGKIAKNNSIITFKDGIITNSVTKPKEGNVTEIVKTFDEAGKIKTTSRKIKDGNYNETLTTFTREEGKTIVKKEGTKADGAKETFETLTMQKNGDKVQVTKESLGSDGKMALESKEWNVKKPKETTAAPTAGDSGKTPDAPVADGGGKTPDAPTGEGK